MITATLSLNEKLWYAAYAKKLIGIGERILKLGPDNAKDLEAEIMRVKAELENQKKIIKKNVSKPLVIETAETEMRALHTRLAVLEANLAKF